VAPLPWPSAPVRTAVAVAGSGVVGCRLSRRCQQSAGRAGQRFLVGPAGHAGSAAHSLLVLVAAAPGIQRGRGSPCCCVEKHVAVLRKHVHTEVACYVDISIARSTEMASVRLPFLATFHWHRSLGVAHRG